MFLIIPFLAICGLTSLLTLAIFAALYGLALIILAMMIRNVRQETSRESLRNFLRFVAYDHFLSASLALSFAAGLTSSRSVREWMPLLKQSGEIDEALVLGIATILGFFMVLWTLAGVLLLLMGPRPARGGGARHLRGWL